MGKIVKVIIFWLLTCSILWSATSYHKQLENYDAQMKSASSDEMLKVFHGLKSIYIQAIISSDDPLKKETLERLIKSAKVLKIDASKYESELLSMNKSSTKEPQTAQKRSRRQFCRVCTSSKSLSRHARKRSRCRSVFSNALLNRWSFTISMMNFRNRCTIVLPTLLRVNSKGWHKWRSVMPWLEIDLQSKTLISSLRIRLQFGKWGFDCVC